MRIGFSLGPAIFGCDGNPVANRRCSGGIPERFSGMGVSPAFLVFSACPVSRFINALKARIDAYQKRKHREGKRVHPTTLHYVWAREFGECKGKKHYHLMLLVNRDTWCRAGDYRAPGSLAGMIKQAWCSALGVDVGCHATLVHFPAWPAVWLERDDDTGFQQVLERADYLAKEHTKAHCTGERNFGCSRS